MIDPRSSTLEVTMPSRIALVSLFIAALLIPASSYADELKASVDAKVYAGPEGERVTMVYLEPASSHRVLIKFENFAGSTWNGKVVLHQTTVSGDGWNRREDFKSAEMGRPTIVAHGEGWRSFEVRPRGVDRDFTVHYDAKQKANAADIIKEYHQDHK
jgi:hypothetical protein